MWSDHPFGFEILAFEYFSLHFVCHCCHLSLTQSDDPEAARKANELPSDAPVDLASLYASGGVDLGTLSELTRSVRETAGVNTDDGAQLRSKRKCVIVREEISKLQEILGEVGSIEAKSSSGVVKPRGRGRGRPPSAGRTSDTGYQEPSPSVRKYRRPAYSQFTHKRRKRRKRQPEEGWCYWFLLVVMRNELYSPTWLVLVVIVTCTAILCGLQCKQGTTLSYNYLQLYAHLLPWKQRYVKWRTFMCFARWLSQGTRS